MEIERSADTGDEKNELVRQKKAVRKETLSDELHTDFINLLSKNG